MFERYDPRNWDLSWEAVITTGIALGVPIVTGRFRKMMKVSLVNEGPVTLLIDTDKVF